MNEGLSMGLAEGRGMPITDIIQLILDRGRLTKDEIRMLWDLTEVQYAELKDQLEDHKLIEPGPRGAGGFTARFNRRPKSESTTAPAESPFSSAHENAALARLVALLTHQDLEDLLGADLVYTIRRARLRLTDEDRRGSKLELAAALLTKHGIDLFVDKAARALLAKRARIVPPPRWYPGKGKAIQFAGAMGFPIEYAGIPAGESPEDFEYLEGRIDLHPLQDFQLEVQRKLNGILSRSAGRAIVTLPTGGGKTRVAVDTIRDWLSARFSEQGNKGGHLVLWLAHTDELCEQACACFKEVWQSSHAVCPMLLFRFWGRYTRDLKRHRETLLTLGQRPTVFVSTPQRIVNLLEAKIAGSAPILEAMLRLVALIVIDEAHRAAAPSYQHLVSAFAKGAQQPAIIGLTATPFRQEYAPGNPTAGTLELRELFTTIIEPLDSLGEDPRQSLQQRGYLAQPIFSVIKTTTRLKVPEGINLDNPSDEDIEKIDYALKLRADRPDRRLIVLEDLTRLCADPASLILYFGPTVQDAECMAFLLRQRAIEAAFICGETRDVTRRKIIGEFKAGRLQVLCNCEVLTTGFDAPKVTHVVLARPTVSQVLYEQMVGRGLRGEKFGGTPTCHVIDLEDNYRSERPELGYKRFRALWGASNK
jgi:superfamily II DNA or RNA helicase